MSYRALAAYASGLAAGRSGPPSPTAFPAGTAIDDPNPLLPWAVRLTFVDLLEEAERIRASLAAVAAHAACDRAGDVGEIRRLMADATSALNLIADTLSTARAKRAALVGHLSARIAPLTIAADATWRWAGEALLGQLRTVARILANLEAVPAQLAVDGTGTTQTSVRRQGGVVAAVATLRANATITSEAGRHALRLAMVAVLAEAIVQATGLYQGRWVTLTIFLVLKLDYGSTFYRSVQRALGTALGAALGAAAVQLAHPGQGGLVAAAGVCIAAAYALFDVSHLLFSVSLTAYIVVLLDLLGMPAIPTAEARILRSDDQKGFVILPRRWVVERTFGWLVGNRRLSRDYRGAAGQ